MIILRLLTLSIVKVLASTFFKFNIQWVGKSNIEDFRNARLMVLLNHTSLYECLFIGAFPWFFLKRMAKYFVLPVAEKTVKRPIVGSLYQLLTAKIVSLSRKRDHTWREFLRYVSDDFVIGIAPEGRMKRLGGLDSAGNTMTVRAGIGDVLEEMKSGSMIIVYSGGLHHVHAPGRLLPRLFKTLDVRFEVIDITDYKRSLLVDPKGDPHAFKRGVALDLQNRRDKNCTFSPKPLVSFPVQEEAGIPRASNRSF